MERTIFIIGMLIFSCCLGRLALGDRAQEAHWDGVAYEGDGCPEGSVRYHASAGKGLKIRLTDLAAVSHKGAPRADSTCTLKLGVRVDRGFQVGIAGLAAAGTVKTGAIGKGEAAVRFSESGGSDTETALRFTASERKTFEAPADRIETTWLPCGQSTTITVNAAAKVAGEGRVAISKILVPALVTRRCAGEVVAAN